MTRRRFIALISTFVILGIQATAGSTPSTEDAQASLPGITVYMIGDSTMATKPPQAEPERGWGQMLPLFFKAEAKISNHAKNGLSSKSFIAQGLWKPVIDGMKKGDWLIIQFGHNDEKSEDPKRYTDPKTTYIENLTMFVKEARAKGANPILCTSLVRRIFSDGILQDTHGMYPPMVRRTASALKVPLIDLESDTRALVTQLGPIKSAELYLLRGEKQDNTHLNRLGGTRIAEMAVARMKALKLPLAAYLNSFASK